MDPVVLAVLIAAVVVVVGVVLVLVARYRARATTAALRSRFGQEYDRVVDVYGHRDGERELRERLRLRSELELRDLEPGERAHFQQAWDSAQSTFVHNPSGGLREVDLLVQQVLRDRGYQADRQEAREKLISVDYPDLVEHYRSAHRTAVDDETEQEPTEDMRRAMVDHQYLFDALLTDAASEGSGTRTTGT